MNFMPISPAQIQDNMSRLRYFDGWEKDQMARLAAGAKQITLEKKGRLVAKGEPVDALYLVVSGQIRLFIPLPNGSERVISMVERGESFGEPCLIQSEPSPYEAIAGKDSHLIAIDALVYRRELRHNPVMAEHALALVSQRLLQTLRDIEICSQPSSVQRVARYLMHLEPEAQTDAFEIKLPALKRDIAAKLGLSQETFSRMLAFMAQQGFIQVTGGSIRVDDRNRMQHLAAAGCPSESAVKN